MKKDEIIQFIEQVFQQEFNNAFIDLWAQTNNKTIFGNLNNNCFWDTRFYAQAIDKVYLHFTKAETAIKILKSGSLWLSNLNKFRDKFEFLLAAQELLDLPLEELQEYKNKIFAACFTELLQNQNVFKDFSYHWSRYSNDKTGVAMLFEFGPKYKEGYLEDTVLFPSYYLMRIQYHDDIRKDKTICRLRNEIEKFKKNSEFNEYGLIEFLFPFLCAYKQKNDGKESFISEKEIRLFYCNAGDSRDCDLYNGNNNEETFSGIDRDIYQPFRQLPFNTNQIFLNLRKLYLGHDITSRDELIISDLASKKGIQIKREYDKENMI